MHFQTFPNSEVDHVSLLELVVRFLGKYTIFFFCLKWEPKWTNTPVFCQITIHSIWWAETYHAVLALCAIPHQKGLKCFSREILTINFLVRHHHECWNVIFWINFISMTCSWQVKEPQNTTHNTAADELRTHTHKLHPCKKLHITTRFVLYYTCSIHIRWSVCHKITWADWK